MAVKKVVKMVMSRDACGYSMSVDKRTEMTVRRINSKSEFGV